MTAALVALALFFAWSTGAHYMGVPHALGALTLGQALVVMAPLAFLGAALATHAVEHTVADRLTVPNLALPAENFGRRLGVRPDDPVHPAREDLLGKLGEDLMHSKS